MLKYVKRRFAFQLTNLIESRLHWTSESGSNEVRLTNKIEELQWGGAARSQMTSGIQFEPLRLLR